MKTVYLNSSYRGVTVSDEVYAHVEKLVYSHCLCGTCNNVYTEGNPQVAQNQCKDCFLRGMGKSQGVSFLDLLKKEENGKAYYRFIDRGGDVYIFCSDYEADRFGHSNKSPRETLKYWGFPALPETCIYEGDEIRLHDMYTHIYGDIRTGKAVLVRYEEKNYSSTTLLWYVSYRGGDLQEFNKRKGEGRKLWQEAKRRAEASKNGMGNYIIHGQTYYQMGDWMLCRLVVDIINEQVS